MGVAGAATRTESMSLHRSNMAEINTSGSGTEVVVLAGDEKPAAPVLAAKEGRARDSAAAVARPGPRGSPSQHVGYLRAILLAAGVASAVWRPAKVLVDSGSQQPPLLSGEFARRLGCQPGAPSGAAAQADGSLLRLYSVGSA